MKLPAIRLELFRAQSGVQIRDKKRFTFDNALNDPAPRIYPFTNEFRRWLDSRDDSEIIDMGLYNKALTVADCKVIASIQTLCFLRCSRCTFPPGAVNQIASENPDLRFLFIDDCETNIRSAEKLCLHPRLEFVGAFESDLLPPVVDDLKECGIRVETNSPIHFLE